MIKKLKIIFPLIILTLLFGCNMDPNPCSLSMETLNDLNRLDSIINITETVEREKKIMDRNYNEPSIFDAKNETYRFIWSSSFDGSEVYRIEKSGNNYVAIKKVFSKHSDTIGVLKELQFSEKNWIHLTGELSSKGFWTYRTTIDRQGLDGTSWSLAAFKPLKDECTLKNFHYISRWSPIDTTFIKMCKLFTDLKEK